MKLAIYAPSPPAYSETFVTMQMEKLPNVLRIFGTPVATDTEPGGRINPFKSLHGLFDIAWYVGVKRTRVEGPQSAELIRRLRKSHADCLLANTGPGACAMLPICKKLSIPLIAHFHGSDAHAKRFLEEYRSSYQELGRNAAAIIAVSTGMVDSLVKAGMPRSKIHLLRYGVYVDKFLEKTYFPETPRFFSVGRFVDKKAPYLTLIAFAKARKILGNGNLVMAGDGPLLETTRNLARVFGVSDSVEFPGILKPDEVARHMREATAFVQHSMEPHSGPDTGDREGTPVAILEAMLTGLPVISTRHAGIPEVVVDREMGWLVDERDVDGMAEGMVALGTSPELSRKMGQAARVEAMLKYTSDNYIAALQGVINAL